MTTEELNFDDELVCPYCGLDWELIKKQWSINENCSCREFLDNPPYLIKKEDFKKRTKEVPD